MSVRTRLRRRLGRWWHSLRLLRLLQLLRMYWARVLLEAWRRHRYCLRWALRVLHLRLLRMHMCEVLRVLHLHLRLRLRLRLRLMHLLRVLRVRWVLSLHLCEILRRRHWQPFSRTTAHARHRRHRLRRGWGRWGRR